MTETAPAPRGFFVSTATLVAAVVALALVAVIVVVPAQQRSREARTFLSGIADKNGMPGAPAQLPGGGGTALARRGNSLPSNTGEPEPDHREG